MTRIGDLSAIGFEYWFHDNLIDLGWLIVSRLLPLYLSLINIVLVELTGSLLLWLVPSTPWLLRWWIINPFVHFLLIIIIWFIIILKLSSIRFCVRFNGIYSIKPAVFPIFLKIVLFSSLVIVHRLRVFALHSREGLRHLVPGVSKTWVDWDLRNAVLQGIRWLPLDGGETVAVSWHLASARI